MEEATKIPSNASSALKAGEFGFPTGHLGHLSASQESALLDFKKICVESGLYKPGSDDGHPPSHSDAVLLRFLRARRFVPKDALQQFRDTEKWRALNEIDKLYENIDIDNYDEARRLYPQWVGRRDKRGIPVYLFEVKPLDSKRMAIYAKSSANTAVFGLSPGTTNTKEKRADSKNHQNNQTSADDSTKTPSRLLRLFALYENLAGFMSTLCTVLTDRPHPETPIVQSNNIVDISGVGLKQFWNLRGHMQDASLLATAHYPETLDRIFIVGAPSFFPTVWSWIKRWFDPITVSKIFILSTSDVYPTLIKFIDPENIPHKFGGTLDFAFGQLAPVDPAYADKIEWKYPVNEQDEGPGPETSSKPSKPSAKAAADEKAEKTESVRRWPRGPVKWVERADGDLDLLAVGSEKGKLRREVVATLRLGGDTVGGSADPTGPLQQRAAKERAHPGGVQVPPGEEKALEAQNGSAGANGAANGLVQNGQVAHVEGEKKGGIEGEENGEVKENGPSSVVADAGLSSPETAAAAAATTVAVAGLEEAKKSGEAVHPAVEPVPLEAVATALPGEGEGEGQGAQKEL